MYIPLAHLQLYKNEIILNFYILIKYKKAVLCKSAKLTCNLENVSLISINTNNIHSPGGFSRGDIGAG